MCPSLYWEGGGSGPALVQGADKREEVKEEGGGERREEEGGGRSLWQASINLNARVFLTYQHQYNRTFEEAEVLDTLVDNAFSFVA